MATQDKFPRTERQEYFSPAVRMIVLSMDNVICGSPRQGGNEDIGYDDWWND